MGLVDNTHSLATIEKLTVSAICRRRLPVVCVRLKMAETLKEAVTFVEQVLSVQCQALMLAMMHSTLIVLRGCARG
jgi:hypothetical protein